MMEHRNIVHPELDVPRAAFARFTNTGAMGALLWRRLAAGFESHDLPTACAIVYARYKHLEAQSWHKSSLSICYRLDLAGRRDDRHEALFYVKAYLGGRSRNEWEKLADSSRTGLGLGTFPTHVPELDAIVWRFPHDPVLTHLSEVIDVERVRTHLPWELLPNNAPGPGDLTDLTNRVAHYLPEKSCTTRYDLRWQEDSTPHELILYGKTFKGEEGKEIYERMVHFWRTSRQDPGSITVAQPIAYRETVKTIWQRAASGVPLSYVIDENNYECYLVAVATGLATLHKSRLASSRTVTIDDHLVESRKKSLKLGQALPTLTRQLDALLRSLEGDAPSVISADHTLIHGDCQLGNLLAQDDRVVFLDFDDCVQGDPTRDVATFIVYLHFYDFAPTVRDAMSEAFLASYRRVVEWEVSIERLSWHLRVQFLNRAYRSYFQQAAGTEQEVLRILDLARNATRLASIATPTAPWSRDVC
ncbi:MAG TPA: phosphotransferase [Nitrospira sp.]|nr:phosphotransferase [Nitrospira sp.]